MSANAHGRDIDVMQMVEVVERFHLLKADGEVVEVSRTENPELFSLVIGGYGMYGVILDVTLEVTRDELYEQRAASVDYKDFPAYFRDSVQADTGVVFMLVRPSIDPDPRQVPEGDGRGDLAPGASTDAPGASRSPRRPTSLATGSSSASRASSTGPRSCAGTCRRRWSSGAGEQRIVSQEQRDAAAAGAARAAPSTSRARTPTS